MCRVKERFRVIWHVSFALVLAFTLTITTLGGIDGLSVQYSRAAGGIFGGGTGTPGDPYMIEDVADLQAMKNNLTAYYALSNNIDASATSGWNGGQGFEPIGDADNRFSGGFDGGNYAITGLYINRPGTNNVGLFGHIGDDTGATVIKNVNLVNTTVIGARGTGTLIGRVTGNANTLIEKCSSVGGSVTGNGATGGLIGSFNSWRTTPGGTDNPVVHYSYTNVAVYSSASGGGRDKFGGLAGCSQKGTIQNSYSRSSVTVTDGSRIGGLAGCIDLRGEILNSYSTGLVSVTNCVSVGGLVGNSEGPGGNFGVVINSFWDIQTSGQATSAGGTGKTTAEMKTETTFTDAGWNFDDIWNIDSLVNDGYPHLVWTNFAPTELTITGTFTAQDKTYDGTNNAEFDTYNLALSGILGGDHVSLVNVIIRFSSINVASNQIVNITSATLAGIDAGKYILSLVGAPTATADITALAISVAADDKSKVQGTIDPALTYQVTTGSLAVGDEFTGELEREPGEAIGCYDILQGTLAIDDGNNGNNYELTFIQGTFSITTDSEETPPVQYYLAISSTEGGSVTEPGEGVFSYDEGTVVYLAAAPDTGYRFDRWTGDVSTIANIESVATPITMNENCSIIAKFAAVSWSPITNPIVPGWCFIATAAYDSPMAEEIQVLREFRDKYMLTNPVGRILVDIYYYISPPIAEFITECPCLKPVVRFLLLPVVAMSTVVVNTFPA